MALDVGSKRIGVAVSDESRTIATPLGVIRRGTGDHAVVRRFVAEWQVERLVIGLPTSLSGREGPQAAEVRAFAVSLAPNLAQDDRLAPTIDFWDERLTTAIADRALVNVGANRAQRKTRIDAVAAAVILQDYLEALRQRRPGGPRPLRASSAT